FTAIPWLLDDTGVANATGGLLLTNRPDYHRNFNGLELSLAKRLSNKWMARAAFSYNDWKEYFGPGAIQDPTKTAPDPQIDGGRGLQRVQRHHGDVPHHRGHVERPRPAQRDPGSAHRPHQR